MAHKDAVTAGMDKAIAKFTSMRELDVEQENWREAFNKKVSLLIWRTISLAIKLDIASPQFNPRDNPLVLAKRVKHDCRVALAGLQPSDDRSDKFHKVQGIEEVLLAIQDAAQTLQNWSGTDPQEIFFLANRSIELGKAEVGLTFAEEGFWEQVAQWRGQKRGRPEGYRIGWRLAVAPALQQWIDEEPDAQHTAYMNKLEDWLKAYKSETPGFQIPDRESLRKAMSAMDKQGLIRLPKRKIGK